MSDSHKIEIQPDNHGIEGSVFSKIKADLSSSSSSSGQSQNCKIRKVQPHDRPQENTSSPYTPKIISIGPLHHGKPQLQPMEDFKHKYLNELLNHQKYDLSRDGKNDELLGRFIEEARKMEEKVRDYYELSNINTISNDDFVRMLVIDGCFLLEFLFRRTKNFLDRLGNFYETSDDLGRQGPLIHHDILLLENQIPFFILQKFYKILTEYGVYESSTMVEVAYRYLYFDTWGNHMTFLGSYFDKSIYGTDSVSNLQHLLHMMLFRKDHQPPFINRTRIIRKWTMALFSWLFVMTSIIEEESHANLTSKG